MKRRRFLSALGSASLLGGGYLGWGLIAPERATAVDDDRVAGATDGSGGTDSDDGADADETGSATVLKRGEFAGKDGHECSGVVELAADDQGRFLQFREFRMTQGPDVYCYLTPAADPDTKTEVAAGTRIRIDGGADGGELTKTGTFAQSLPTGVDDDAMGVAAWCDDFSVPFGAATLESV